MPATRFDDGYRSDVVLVTGHECPLDSVSLGDDKALPEDLGSVAAPPVLGKDAIADVAAFSFEKVVEGMTDRGPADDLSCYFGDQESPWNPAAGKFTPAR